MRGDPRRTASANGSVHSEKANLNLESQPQDIESAAALHISPRWPGRPRIWVAFALVVAGAVALTFYRLGACGICKGNEAVEAVFIQQMVEHGKVLFPAVNGGSPMYKPPLFHWTATALDRLAGIHRVTPFNFRLPAALYTVAGVGLTMVFAYGVIGGEGAILAGLILLSAHQYIRLGRMGRVDMTLTFFETLALFAFWWWLERWPQSGAGARNRNAMIYVAAVAAGLAVLSKGPVGALLPGLAIAIFLIVERRLGDVVRRIPVGAAALAVAIGASWYLAGYLDARHALLSRQLGSENFGRFFGALGSSPPWFYLGPLLFSSLPVSLLIPIAVASVLVNRKPEQVEESVQCEDAIKLLAIFWLVTLAFFSIAAYKSRWYLLPLWPSAAVILAWWIKRSGALYGRRPIEGGFAAVCVAVAIFNLFYIPHQERRECARYGYRAAAAGIRSIVGPSQPLYAAGFVDEDFAPLLFYLDRDAPFVSSDLAKAPPGYIIVPEKLWNARKDYLRGYLLVMRSSEGRRKPVLLRHFAHR
jgi:4-amino-4-deoxy-L-arabinose transferase-like glycosyltransferase